jgi:deoxyribodipyrimidine photo-lyase
MTKLFIFYRDLRFEDNTALNKLKLDSNTQYVCIDDPVIFRNKFVMEFYTNIIKSLHKKIIRFSSPNELMKFIKTHKFDIIAFNKNLLIWDNWQKPIVDEFDNVLYYEDYTLVNEDKAKNKQGEAYKVYTPFYMNVHLLLPTPQLLTIPEDFSSIQRKEAFEILDDIKNKKFEDYKKERDYPSMNGTTKIGKYLSYGVISIREIYNAIGSKNHELVRELLWRDFFYFCHDHLKNRITKVDNDNNTIAWTSANKFIKAGIKELKETGWVNNRLRMNISMYAIKRMNISPSKVAEWFSKYMIDYYESSNDGGIFWVINQPTYREFNYDVQMKKYDPDEIYVSKVKK